MLQIENDTYYITLIASQNKIEKNEKKKESRI